MPIFRAGNVIVNLPEDASFTCVASKDTAEYHLLRDKMTIGKTYRVSVVNGELVAKEVINLPE